MSNVSLINGHDDDTPLMVNKLVRDNIPDIIKSGGQDCEFKILSKEDYIYALEKKLDEELAEYREDHSLEELADVFEVLNALVQARGYSFVEVVDACMKKCDERGGFGKRIFLTKIYP